MIDPLAKKTFDEEEQVVASSLLHPSPTIAVEEWTLRIKSCFQDTEIQIPSNAIVSHVKDQIRINVLPPNDDASSRYMRLICKGRLLTPDHAPLHEFNVQNGDAVHAVLAAATTTTATVDTSTTTTTSTTTSTNTNRQRRRRRRRGTVVGPGGRVTRASQENGGESSSSEEDGDDEERGERMGFDRLRYSGLSRQEITAIRAYFSRHVDRYAAQLLATAAEGNPSSSHADEPDLQRRRLLIEDDWMALQGPTSEFRLNLNQNTLMRFASMANGNSNNNSNLVNPALFQRSTTLGSDRDFMWGFMLGFFVGFVMLIWVWMPTIPHKQKLGILTGISFQLALNVVQEEQQDEFDQD